MENKLIKTEVLVIGGGPAGMMAALTAANRGRQVILAEKNDRLGRKLLITGKGRCNVTNNCPSDELVRKTPNGGRFLYSAFSSFSSEDTIAFFENAGIPLKTERGQRVFPESDKAADIERGLESELRKSGAEVLRAKVLSVSKKDGFITKTDIGIIESQSVIIATGGLSYPRTGSTGDGYRFAKGLSHSIIEPAPALIPIITEGEDAPSMQGLSLKNVTLKLFKGDKKKPIYEELGELLFTHFGLSGPLVLTASCHMKGKADDYSLVIDFKPALSKEKLNERILRDFSENINKSITNCLGLLLPQKAIPVIIKRSFIDPDKKVNSITASEREALIENIKALIFKPTGFRPIDEAIITSGGVNLTEINPKTMESKLSEGLYFAGEIIDVNAYTGGFNLQIAFSTGYVAGMNA